MPDPLPLADGRLPQALVKRYRDEGFLFPIRVMDAAEASALRTELETIEHDWRDNGLPLPLNTYKRVNSHCVLPLSCRIAADPRILDVVEGVLGPDILVYSAEYFIKEPHTRHIVSMHQDLTYWGLGATSGMVTVWLALSPATPQSGCMDFVRGSHRNPILPHEDTFDALNLLSRGQEIRVAVAEEDKVPIVLAPGQISLHHGLTIHGSGPNVSDDRRIACAIRYIRPDVAQEVGARDYAMLARGADRSGNFIHFAPPIAPFEPRALALYEEIRAEQAKVYMDGVSDDSARSGIYG